MDYVANYIADKAFQDPNAKFSWSELASNMASGGLSGAVFAGTGVAANRVNTDTNGPTRGAAQSSLAEQITTMQKQLADMQFQKQVDELAAVYEKNVGPIETIGLSEKALENMNESDIIKSFQIGKSVGAGAKNYPVKLPDSRQHVKLAEGQTIEGKAFAGKGTNTEIRDRFRLENTYKVDAAEWQKVSGKAYIVLEGRRQKVELHWYEANGKKVEMKVKWYLDED